MIETILVSVMALAWVPAVVLGAPPHGHGIPLRA
jgi:hypothetical protein